MRVAAIDIGTNTVLLLVAEREAAGLRALREEATITRLGEGVDKTHALAPTAIERTNACLARYAEIVREVGAVRVGVVGTSAMRDAGGGDEVRARVRDLFGVEARTISGEEEARLTFAGALSGLDASASSSTPTSVFDIGGGSTEIVVGQGGVVLGSHSFDVGSVRLTERHVTHDPPTEIELDAMRQSVRATFATMPRIWAAARGTTSPPVGIAGTVTTLAAVLQELERYDGSRVHGCTMTGDDVARLTARLASMPLSERKRVRGLEPKRADVIVAGGILVECVLEAFGATSLRVSDRGVRWGLAEELAR